MRLVAVTTVLDEADIIESFIRHTASYVDHHIILDHGSRDGTVEIIRKLRAEGYGISLLHNDTRSFQEPEQRTLLASMAMHRAQADWVLLLDADEFIDDRRAEGGLRGALGRVKSAVSCVRVMCVNYMATSQDDQSEIITPRRMRHRAEIGRVPKVMVRGNLRDRQMVIKGGSHGVLIDGGRICPSYDETEIVLAHYAERSPYQTITKFLRGWSRALAGGDLITSAGHSKHYRSRFELLRDDPARLLRGDWFNNFNRSPSSFTDDPIEYRGGELRYTGQTNEPMRMCRSMVGWLESVSRQHGKLLDECPGARETVDRWAIQFGEMGETTCDAFQRMLD